MRFQVLIAGLCLLCSACSEIFSRGHDPTLGENNHEDWGWDEGNTNESSASDGFVEDDGMENSSEPSSSDSTTGSTATATDTNIDEGNSATITADSSDDEAAGDATSDSSEEGTSGSDGDGDDGQSDSESEESTDETGDIGDMGESSDTGEDPDPLSCHELRLVLRDFSDLHEDFEVFAGEEAFEGIVDSELGSDRKPIYAHLGPTEQTSGPSQFYQWYNDSELNQKFEETIQLTEVSTGIFQYSNHDFFPLDNMGWGNEDRIHNYHFTSEMHAEFDYQGGEAITFGGDDDLWLFINGVLAIDLGGLHPPLSETIVLDEMATELGIRIGQRYALEIFHAERHTEGSNFQLETTISCLMPLSIY